MDISTFLQPADRIVTLPEAASFLGVSIDTLRRRNKAGEIEIVRLSPRRVGIRMKQLERYIAQHAA